MNAWVEEALLPPIRLIKIKTTTNPMPARSFRSKTSKKYFRQASIIL
jgi:hypothetical protein